MPAFKSRKFVTFRQTEKGVREFGRTLWFGYEAPWEGLNSLLISESDRGDNSMNRMDRG